MKKPRRLCVILLVSLVSVIRAKAATVINPMPVMCPAVLSVLTDVNSFRHPNNWKVIVVCSPDTWSKLKARYPIVGSRTDYALTFRSLHLTFVNAESYGWESESKMRFVLAHEAGHLMCGCDDEARADQEAEKMLGK